MRIFKFITVFFLLLISFSVITKPPVSMAAAYTIVVNAKFTSNGTPKTYPSVIVTIMDAVSGAPLSANFANGGRTELNTKPSKFWIKILASENGRIVYTHQSDIVETGSENSYPYNPTIEVETLNGPATSPSPGSTTPSPSAGSTTPSPGASGTSPTPGAGVIGWCGDSGRDESKFIPVPAGTTPPCTKGAAFWVPGTNSDKSDPYCKGISGGLQPYFYKCDGAGGASGTPTPTKNPTPTPYVPIAEGKACVPSQGPWQCVGGNYCAQSCSSFSASCTSGVCCRNGFVWSTTANTCIPPVSTPTPSTAAPTPIGTSGTCNDSIQTSAGTVSQVCTTGSACAGGAIKNPDAAASESCSLFYSGGKDKTGYTCCQQPVINQSGAGSSCQVSGRLCDTTKNAASGQNIQCSGCGGYCIKPSSGDPAFCQSI